MWELVKAPVNILGLVEGYLKEGYEPFAVDSFQVVWLKREVKPEVSEASKKEFEANLECLTQELIPRTIV